MHPCRTRPSTFPRTISLSISERRSSPAATCRLPSALRSNATSRSRTLALPALTTSSSRWVLGPAARSASKVSCSGEWYSSEGERFQHFRVWRGPKRFALHIERTEYFEMRDAEGNPLTGWRAWTGIGMASGGGRPAAATLDVYDTLEELREHVPAEFWAVVSASVKHPYVEDLDI